MSKISKIKLNDTTYDIATSWEHVDNKPTIPTKTSDLQNDNNFLTQHQDISGKEDVSNKVSSVSSNSTDTQYPTAKCLYDKTRWIHINNIDDAVNQDCFYIYTAGTNYNKQVYFLICVGDNVENAGGVRTQYRCNATPSAWERNIQYRSQRYSSSKGGWINDKDEVGGWTDWTSINSSSGEAVIDTYSKDEIDSQNEGILIAVQEVALETLLDAYDFISLTDDEYFNTYGTQELIDYIQATPKEETEHTESNIPDGLNGHYEVPLGFEVIIPTGGATITLLDTVSQESWIDSIENNINKWANITNNQDNENKYYITNLIPNRLYIYKIKDNEGNILQTGKCKAKDQVRFIDAGKVIPYNLTDSSAINTTTRQYYNIRDLGGWSCDGGHKLKYGVIYRGCELSGTYTFGNTTYGFQLPEYQKLLFKNFLNIQDEIDLRQNSFILGSSYKETAGDDQQYNTLDDINESAIGAGVDYGHFPGIAYKLNSEVEVAVDGDTVIYNSRLYYINAIKRIAKDIQENKPIYIHCSAGADRTGTLCMLIEGLCGVSESDLERDYELTSYSKNFKSQQNVRKRSSSDWKSLLSYIKNGYEPYIDSFRDKIVAFLIQSGITIDEINIIRGGLIDGIVDNLQHPYYKVDITRNLTNVSLDNNITKINRYEPFKARVQIKDGYTLNQISVIMISGTSSPDITGIAYSNGIIDIPIVKGPVTITATAIPNNTLYQSLIDSNNKIPSDLIDDTNQSHIFMRQGERSLWTGKYTKPDTGIPKSDLSQDVQSILNKTIPDLEHGVISSDNKGWYTEENGVTKYLTGTYKLIDDMCILAGKAQIPYDWTELYYTLPITPIQGAATVSFDGGVYYYIGTTMRSSETITNASVMRIARVDGERFSADTTIHFVLIYPYR